MKNYKPIVPNAGRLFIPKPDLMFYITYFKMLLAFGLYLSVYIQRIGLNRNTRSLNYLYQSPQLKLVIYLLFNK